MVASVTEQQNVRLVRVRELRGEWAILVRELRAVGNGITEQIITAPTINLLHESVHAGIPFLREP